MTYNPDENKSRKKTIRPIIGAIIGIPVTIFGLMFAYFWFFGEDEPDTQNLDSTYTSSQEGGSPLTSRGEFAVTVSGDFAPIDYDNTQVFTNDDMDWVMYWYLCGSDLETYYGAATDDLIEMMEVDLPENVQVVIQTGGANQWNNELVDESVTQRFLYDQDGLFLLEEFPMGNMGEAETLADFLIFAKENYPAQNVMFNFWNHGGGSISGVAFDENYQDDALTLPEMHHAFTSVYQENSENPPFAIIGFDACLMATLDTAYVFSDLAEYMVASEELEPGIGWNYTGFLSEVANNPQISPEELGIAICDSYYEACVDNDLADDVTLSLVDLGKLDGLLEVFELYGLEALENASQNPSFFNQFAQIAISSENYGGNNRSEGYTNMVDLGHLAELTQDLLPETSATLTAALENCVPYRVAGYLRPDSHGLATYYYYDGDYDSFLHYTDFGPSQAVKYLYDYGLTGTLTPEGLDYLNRSFAQSEDSQSEATPEITDTNTYAETVLEYEDCEVTIDENGNASIYLGSEAFDILTEVGYSLFYVDEAADTLLCLGYDNEIERNWEECQFSNDFRGVWGSLDGYLCYMELSYEGSTYNDYAVPILLNGESYNLEVVYDFNLQEFIIKGARKAVEDSGKASKNLRKLTQGDVIDILHMKSSFEDEDDSLYEEIVATITVDENTSFYEVNLDAGTYLMTFTLSDYHGNVAHSQVAGLELDGSGGITAFIP